jgi:hypothetical protein
MAILGLCMCAVSGVSESKYQEEASNYGWDNPGFCWVTSASGLILGRADEIRIYKPGVAP